MTASSQQTPVGERERETPETYLSVTSRAEARFSASWAQWLETRSAEDIMSAQQGDKKIEVVLKWPKTSPVRPTWESICHLDGDMKAYWAHWGRLISQDGILRSWLFDEVTSSEQPVLVVPEAWR